MNVVIIAAAGTGERFGSDGKTFAALAGRPVLWHSVKAFSDAKAVDRLVIVARAQSMSRCRAEIIQPLSLADRATVVAGGSSRQESVGAGLRACPTETSLVLIHDGARPLVEAEWIDRSVRQIGDNDGLIFAEPVHDTVKRVDDRHVLETIPRSELWRAQTPQVFRFPVLVEAYDAAEAEGFVATDDAALVERLGRKVAVFDVGRSNLKITTPADLRLAEWLLTCRPD